MGITSISMEGLTSALNGLNIGGLAATNLVIVVMTMLIAFAITRNLRSAVILQLPLALSFRTMGLYVGVLPIAIYAVLFVVNTFNISGLVSMISTTAEKAADTFQTQRFGLSSYHRASDRRKEAKAMTEKALDTKYQAAAEEGALAGERVDFAKKRLKNYLDASSPAIQAAKQLDAIRKLQYEKRAQELIYGKKEKKPKQRIIKTSSSPQDIILSREPNFISKPTRPTIEGRVITDEESWAEKIKEIRRELQGR